MKNPVLICIMLLAGCPVAHGQITLNTGDSYTYEFSSLTNVFDLSFGTVHGQFRFTVTPGTLGRGDLLQWEMFEDGPSGSPLHIDTYSLASPNDSYLAPGAWQDLQGSIRFTMLSGSIGIDNFSMSASVPIGPFLGWHFYHGFVIPVQEVPPIDGDLTGDGNVDAADYVVWRKDLGTTYSPADYDTWRAQFGQTVAAAGATGSANGSAAVPEPASLVLAGLAVAILATRWTRSETRDGSRSNMGNIQ